MKKKIEKLERALARLQRMIQDREIELRELHELEESIVEMLGE